MEIFQIIGIGFIGLICSIILKQYRSEFSIYIAIVTGIYILVLIWDKLSGIFELIRKVINNGGINSEYIEILIKITFIAILTEFAVNICKDAGESAIASKIDLGGKIIIIASSIPILSVLVQTIISILP